MIRPYDRRATKGRRRRAARRARRARLVIVEVQSAPDRAILWANLAELIRQQEEAFRQRCEAFARSIAAHDSERVFHIEMHGSPP